MRMSCNGCRVLRKGCSENCSLRPCLQWIKSPDSQANATVFLAKFYGRAALINLINVGPHHLRPAIFRSLLYEACGRIINPVNGSVGLMSSGNWQRCQEAVELVLKGSRIMQIPINDDDNTDQEGHPFKSCDIRHISKSSSNSDQLQVKIRNGRFKRKTTVDPVFDMMNEPSSQFSITGWDHVDGMEDELIRAQSHNSSSVEMGEPSLLLNCVGSGLPEENRDVGLELTLGS